MKRLATLSVIVLLVVACATTNEDPNKRAKRGAAIGAAAGAVAGAVIGNQSGDPRTGAVIGAAVGTGVGAAVGHSMDQQQKELQQIEGVEVQRTANDELNVVIRNNILFDFNSSSLRPESRSTLRDMSGVFSRYPDTRLTIDGYTDSVGTADYNLRLSRERAQSVSSYLIDQGVSSSRITTNGYGESDPVATNDTPEGRQLNRRVEIHVKANPQS